MSRFPNLTAILFAIAVTVFALVVAAGHKPVCCKGYMYWDILEPHGAGKRWRKVSDPVTFRQVPITPSIWELGEAKSRSLLYMHAKAQRSAGNLEVKVRDWDAECWHYGDAEPSRLKWPVQP
jgi:hypothetical protein